MKICLISGLYKPYIVGGGEVYVETIAHALSRYNEVVIISTSPDSGSKPTLEFDGNVKVYRFRPILNTYDDHGVESLGKKIQAVLATAVDIWNPHSYRVVKRILKSEKPDLVHIHGLRHISSSVFAATKSAQIPCIHTCHSYLLMSIWPTLFNYSTGNIVKHFNLFEQIYMKIRRYLSNSVDMTIAPTQFVLDMYSTYGFFRNANSVVLPNPIDLGDAIQTSKTYDTIDILYVGQLTESKGVHTLIAAFKQINKHNLRLHIVGKGPFGEQLGELATADSRISFYGFMQYQNVIKLYKKANITVVPSIWYEVFGMVSIESFKYGTPVIASDIGGIPEIVDKSNGLLFEAGNPSDLKKRIEDLIEDRQLLKDLEKGAFNASSLYNIDKHVADLQHLYLNTQNYNKSAGTWGKSS